MYSDAVIQTCVQHSLHALVQPRLDGLADRLAGVVSSAQNELRELERCVERSEARLDGRLAKVESKLAVLSDGAARAEQRERDLNTRIAAIAEGMLRRSAEDATAAEGLQLQGRGSAADAGITPGHVADIARHIRDAEGRIEALEESSRKGAKGTRRLEEHLECVDEQTRSVGRLGERLQSLVHELSLRSGGEAEGAIALQRVSLLEEDLRALGQRLAAPERSCCCQAQLAALDLRLEGQRGEAEGAAAQLMDRYQELHSQTSEHARRHEEQREESRASAERQLACAARLDDMNLRLGALKVKVDGLEGRVASVGERAEAARKPREAQLQQDLADRCRRAVGELEPRLEVVERQLGKLQDACEDAVEQAVARLFPHEAGDSALHRRLGLAAELSPGMPGRDGPSSRDRSERRRDGLAPAGALHGTPRSNAAAGEFQDFGGSRLAPDNWAAW